jgi:membrane dipeptidase
MGVPLDVDGPVLSRRQLLASAAAAGLAWGCGSGPPELARVPAEIRAFHDESLVFDLHVDTLLWMRLLGYDVAKRHRPVLPGAPFAWQMDLPRAREGGLDGAVLGIVVSPDEELPGQILPLRVLARVERRRGLPQTLATLDLLAATARSQPGQLAFARSGSELRAAIAAGRFGALAGLEGAHGLGERVENVRAAWERGLRMIGLVHFQPSAAAHPMTDPVHAERGLTPFGFELVREMESLGIVVDLAHVNARGVEDALGALRRPFVVSHSGARSVRDHPRNLDDEQIRRIADRGGVIGIAVGREFLGPGGLDAFLAHAERLRQRGGEDCPAIGSDWDGGIVPAPGLEDVRALPLVTQGLLARGFSPEATRKLLGENALRVITEVCG